MKQTYFICIYFAIMTLSCFNDKAKEEDKYVYDDRIVINYSTSFRVPHNRIICTLYKDYQNNEKYKMTIQTTALIYKESFLLNAIDENGRQDVEANENFKQQWDDFKKYTEESANMNINETIEIDKYFFEKIASDIWDIDIKKIIRDKNKIIGFDGSDLTIEHGTSQYYRSITVWNPKETEGEIGKINKIVLEVFDKAGLIEWY